MTDKVHKIREEVARIQLYTQSEVLKQVLDYIDEVQKEPVSMWHDASEEPKPNMELICVGQYGNPLVLSSNSDSFKSRDISKWAYFNDLLNLSNVQRTVKNWKEPVSDDLELTWKDLALIRLAFDATEDNINHGCLKISPMTKEYYEEVLKRFKERKVEEV